LHQLLAQLKIAPIFGGHLTRLYQDDRCYQRGRFDLREIPQPTPIAHTRRDTIAASAQSQHFDYE